MDRRSFLGTGLAAGLGAAGGFRVSASGQHRSGEGRLLSGADEDFLKQLRETCRKQLFDEYLPFWENGGHDAEHGGFMCYLHEDGTVQDDRKDIWYQGRGIWVYAYLYNEIDKQLKWLERAKMARDFMVRHMHRGDGTWLTTVNRTGQPVSSIAVERSNNIYGALFAAAGLIQLARATGREEDLELARQSIWKSLERYEDPGYGGVGVPGIDSRGLRAQGHSFMFVWVIPQLLELDNDARLREVLDEHLGRLENDFWNPDFGISNEHLFHDYSRIPSKSGFMVPGHSIEAQWMCMEAVLWQGNEKRAREFASRMHRLVEMSWDYVFRGTGDTAYNVFSTEDHPAGPVLDEKTMWAQTEVALGCFLAHEKLAATWAREWFVRSWSFLQDTMTTPHGVWRQAVDRQGRDKQREGISVYRRGNFHQPRCLMSLIRSVDRLL